ncbi:MAG: tRNA (cytidine(34)-2'-O)-methyltransferase [Planctomycetota bacterium]
MRSPPIHVVLYKPEIPNNTGAIGRLCVGVGARLHLIHPLGFDLDEKARRRAGLDYWPRIDLCQHTDWDAYLAATPGARRWLLTAHATRTVFDAELRSGDHLVFGPEGSGLPPDLLDSAPDQAVGLPMLPGERSMNVANVACAVVYESLRQQLTKGVVAVNASGRLELS